MKMPAILYRHRQEVTEASQTRATLSGLLEEARRQADIIMKNITPEEPHGGT